MKNLKDINRARKLLNDFSLREYDKKFGEVDNVEEVGIAYTTSEDEEIEIQCVLNLINNDFIVYWDDIEVAREHYEKDEDFLNFLTYMDFDCLVCQEESEQEAYHKAMVGKEVTYE